MPTKYKKRNNIRRLRSSAIFEDLVVSNKCLINVTRTDHPVFSKQDVLQGLLLLTVACELLHLAGAVQELHELATED